jgi:hypothetical protein
MSNQQIAKAKATLSQRGYTVTRGGYVYTPDGQKFTLAQVLLETENVQRSNNKHVLQCA